jgi:hypothetical protein
MINKIPIFLFPVSTTAELVNAEEVVDRITTDIKKINK